MRCVSNPGGTPPIVLLAPPNISAFEGTRIAFTNYAIGTPKLFCFWFRDDRWLSSAFAWEKRLYTDDTGWYSVVVTNLYGGVTNSFYLSVHPADSQPSAPALSSPYYSPDQGFRLSLTNELGWPISLQYSTNLVNWQDLTHFISVSNRLDILDMETNAVQRFYRAINGP